MSTLPLTSFVDVTTNGHIPSTQGLTIPRYFTDGVTHPYDNIEWENRTAEIIAPDGEVIFRQENVEFPKTWSQQATNIVAQKYFRGPLGSPERESSVKTMIDRVVYTITKWGWADGYFTHEQGTIFAEELTFILVNQMASFNSPVWFNIGVPHTAQQASACFILDVDDNLDSIFNWYVEEGNIFANGSGSGTNLSKIRGKTERLSGGGLASGPLSFDRVADANGGVIKSGGKTRRSARMIILDVDHPDIEDFIQCKVKEEKKARVLMAAGYDNGIDGEIYQTLAHQNGNYSIGVTNAFMLAVEKNGWCETKYRTTGDVAKSYEAQKLFHSIAYAAHECADPGIQFQDTMNAWHTCPHDGRITTTNPCSEFIFLNNNACNLSSTNLIKFLMKDKKTFDTESFSRVVDTMVIAKDILVGRAEYPTEKIKEQSHKFRTIGLGYNNLGGLLMVKGLSYDSDAGRNYTASITALMTGRAYLQSAHIAEKLGAFPGYKDNTFAMLGVIAKHYESIPQKDHGSLPDANIWMTANNTWVEAECSGITHGYRNAQVSLLQPGGTVSFMMDCATTGMEPEVALVKYKKLSGGGTMKMVNPLVGEALHALGYSGTTIKDNCAYIEKYGSLDGVSAMWLKPEHRAIFDCAFPSTPEGRSIAWEGHVKMVAAIQPFLSGGVSKTINMPNNSTVEDVERAYMMAWKLGLKSISIYRDGCKFQQPMTTQQEKSPSLLLMAIEAPIKAVEARRRLPDERPALTHKYALAGHEGYITAGLYEDGSPGEVFLKMSKEGSTIAGLMDTIATLTSLALQYGVPLQAMVEKFTNVRFEPSGFTKNKDIPMAKSLTDYIFRWLGQKFLATQSVVQEPTETTILPLMLDIPPVIVVGQTDAPLCTECGNIMDQRSGSCWCCSNCGTSGGCS